MALTISVNEIISKASNPLLGIAPSWTRILLGEVADILNGYPFESRKFSKVGGFPLLRIRNIRQNDTDTFYDGDFDSTFVVRRGDLVIGMDGDFNSARWKGSDALLNQRVCKVTVVSPFYDATFLELALPGYLNAINEATSSVTVKHLSSLTVAQIPLPLPPLSEQRRIVAKAETLFTRLDASVTALKRVQTALKRYKAAVLKAACEGRLVSQDPNDEPASKLLERILAERRAKWEVEVRAKGKYRRQSEFEEQHSPSGNGLPELPAGWVWTKLGSVFRITIGGTPSRGSSEYWGGEIPWVSSGEVAFSHVLDTHEKITSKGLANSNAKLHPKGTVLLAMIGEGKTRGQSAILDVAATTNQNVASILCAATLILPLWVFYWLMSRYEETRKSGLGGMQFALNSERIRNFDFRLPPVEEQKRIVAEIECCLSVVQELDATVEASLTRAERLRQAILTRAFEGRLVAQEANDEPAEELLEQIRGAGHTL